MTRILDGAGNLFKVIKVIKVIKIIKVIKFKITF